MLTPLITEENLDRFAYTNRKLLNGQPVGIVTEFFGLNTTKMFDEDTPVGKLFAEKNILYVLPYTNPWAWMNPQAVAYTDEVIRVLAARYNLQNRPIAVTGGSMGGMSAIVYSRYAARTPVACVANCPVCDLPYHLTERPDLPRTLYSAFWHEDGQLEDVLKRFSPFHLVNELPKIPYTVYHCEADRSVNIQRHSERFVSAMVKAGHTVRLVRVPDRNHCDLPPEVADMYRNDAIAAILNRQ